MMIINLRIKMRETILLLLLITIITKITIIIMIIRKLFWLVLYVCYCVVM